MSNIATIDEAGFNGSLTRVSELDRIDHPTFDSHLGRASTALALADRPEDIARIASWAGVLRVAAQRATLGMQEQNRAAELRLRAERRLGELLTGRVNRGRPRNVDVTTLIKLPEIGVSRDLSARAQRIAAIPPQYFERYFREAHKHGWEITSASFFARAEADQIGEQTRARHFATARNGKSNTGSILAFPTSSPRFDLHHGDCLNVMAELPAQSVDMILADLPFGITKAKWDRRIPLAELWRQFERVLRPNHVVVLHGRQPFTSELVMSRPELFKFELVWIKSKAGNFVHANDAPLQCHENLLIFSAGALCPTSRSSRRMPYFPRGLTATNDRREHRKSRAAKSPATFGSGVNQTFLREWTGYPRSVLEFPRDEPALHPTQKPVALVRWLIEMFTQPGETVMDACMGSGSTGVAALAAGRSFIGIERDDHYFQVAADRLGVHDATKQP